MWSRVFWFQSRKTVPGLAVLAPPRGGHQVGGAALDLAGEGERGPAHLGEGVLGADADVDVQALAARGLREARRRRGRRGPRARPPATRRTRRELDAGHRVEVDAPLVGGLDVGGAGVPGVELHGRHLHGPDHVGDAGDAQLVGGAVVAGEVHAHRAHPVRRALGQALLVDLLAVDAGGEAVHHAGPVAQRPDDAVGDGEVVVGEIEFRFSARREVHPVGVRQAHGPAVDLDLRGLGHGR